MVNIGEINEKFEKLSEFLESHSNLLEEIYNDSNSQKTNVIWGSKDAISAKLGIINQLNFKGENIVEEEMNICLYIMSIDVILEAMDQINRVVFNACKSVEYKSSIFKNEENKCDLVRFSSNDREYFKNIRAVFTAHSSNLELEQKSNKSKLRFVSSWILGDKVNHPGDYGCIVYSLNEDVDDLYVGITIKALTEFLDEIFNNVDTLINKIIENGSNHIFSDINIYRKSDAFGKISSDKRHIFNELRKIFKLYTLKKEFGLEEANYFTECVNSYYYLRENIKTENEDVYSEIKNIIYIKCPDEIKSSFKKIEKLPENLSSFEDEIFENYLNDLNFCIEYIRENKECFNEKELKEDYKFIEKLLFVKSNIYALSELRKYKDYSKIPEIIVKIMD